MIESLRPVAAVGVCLLAAGLILLFGNRLHRNLREGITIAAAVCAAGLVFSMTPAVLDGQIYEARLWQIAEGDEPRAAFGKAKTAEEYFYYET